MLHGLMWFPLLGIFFWLAKAGYDEYQKLEAYKKWAVGFDRCKYDIYSTIGIKERDLTWGKPTKSGSIDFQTFSLDRVSQVQLIVDARSIDLNELPTAGKKIDIQFRFADNLEDLNIPFTEIPLAAEWAIFLSKSIDLEIQGKRN
jgi:hypothetical protein